MPVHSLPYPVARKPAMFPKVFTYDLETCIIICVILISSSLSFAAKHQNQHTQEHHDRKCYSCWSTDPDDCHDDDETVTCNTAHQECYAQTVEVGGTPGQTQTIYSAGCVQPETCATNNVVFHHSHNHNHLNHQNEVHTCCNDHNFCNRQPIPEYATKCMQCQGDTNYSCHHQVQCGNEQSCFISENRMQNRRDSFYRAGCVDSQYCDDMLKLEAHLDKEHNVEYVRGECCKYNNCNKDILLRTYNGNLGYMTTTMKPTETTPETTTSDTITKAADKSTSQSLQSTHADVKTTTESTTTEQLTKPTVKIHQTSHATTRGVVVTHAITKEECMVCNETTPACNVIGECKGADEQCYIQQLQFSTNGTIIYRAGCIHTKECTTVATTSKVRGLSVLQGECCTGYDCNRHILTTYKASSTTTTTTTTKTVPIVSTTTTKTVPIISTTATKTVPITSTVPVKNEECMVCNGTDINCSVIDECTSPDEQCYVQQVVLYAALQLVHRAGCMHTAACANVMAHGDALDSIIVKGECCKGFDCNRKILKKFTASLPTAIPEFTTSDLIITTSVPSITTSVPSITTSVPSITISVPSITTSVPVKNPECMSCDQAGQRCNVIGECSSIDEKCYIQQLQFSTNGTIIYHAGCIVEKDCTTVATTSKVRGMSVLQGECCTGYDCNRHILATYKASEANYTKTQHVSSAATSGAPTNAMASTTVKAATVSSNTDGVTSGTSSGQGVTTLAAQTTTNNSLSVSPTAPPATKCEVCSGGLCGVVVGQGPSVECEGETPYCMNTVHNAASTLKTYEKRCASETECNTMWWKETSDKTECVGFKPLQPYPFAFSCNYCCVEDNCNSKIYPDFNTLFQGSG